MGIGLRRLAETARLSFGDAQTGKEILALKAHTQGLTCVAFSPNGRQILTASRDSKAILWAYGGTGTRRAIPRSRVSLPLADNNKKRIFGRAIRRARDMAYLKVVRGVSTGQIWEIKGPKTVLGRHPESDIPIDVPDASRHHAQVTMVGGEYFVEDLHSRNGTSVNDEPIEGLHKLNDGDRIRITTVVLKFFAGSFIEKRAENLPSGDVSAVLECVPDSSPEIVRPAEPAADEPHEPSSVELGLHVKVRAPAGNLAESASGPRAGQGPSADPRKPPDDLSARRPRG